MTTDQSSGSWPALKAYLCGRVRPDDPVYTGMVRRWFDDTVEGPGAPLWRGLAERTAPPGASTDWPASGWRYGDSFDGVWAEQDFLPSDVEPEVAEAPFTPEAWQELRATVGTVPGAGYLGMFDLEEISNRPLPGTTSLYCKSDVVPDEPDDSPGWYTLETAVSATLIRQVPDGPATLLALLRTAAEVGNPTYGEIAVNSRMTGWTAREAARPDHSDPIENSVRASATQCRGYGWVTVLGQELGERLGGLSALRGSGAFVEVEPLASGGFWLLATHRFEDFKSAAASRVFKALSPVLDRANRPNLGIGYEELRPALAGEDVAPPRPTNDLSTWLPR